MRLRSMNSAPGLLAAPVGAFARADKGDRAMIFVWMGLIKEGEEVDQPLQQQISGFLEQPYLAIESAGALRDEAGGRAGYLVLFEAENRAAAEALVAESPVRRAGLYSEYHLFEYQREVG
jgi:uncharacterized protein YciI